MPALNLDRVFAASKRVLEGPWSEQNEQAFVSKKKKRSYCFQKNRPAFVQEYLNSLQSKFENASADARAAFAEEWPQATLDAFVATNCSLEVIHALAWLLR
jgi:SPX domain protein involved in polyphosphate accumulation